MTSTTLSDAELVRLVAEKVMGWHPLGGHLKRWYGDGRELAQAVIAEWNPLNNDADCMAVLDKMAADGWSVSIDHEPMISSHRPGWTVRFQQYIFAPSYRDHSDVVPAGHANSLDRRRAIVLAALRAVGVEV